MECGGVVQATIRNQKSKFPLLESLQVLLSGFLRVDVIRCNKLTLHSAFLPRNSCPHCINLGGSLARCGITGGRNYDHPMNFDGAPLQWSTESNYDAESIIDIDTVITTHHKGHIEVKACPMATQDGNVASQSCFDSHPLEFVSDELYGAPKDVNYPGRAYLAPKYMTQTDTSGKSLRELLSNLYAMPCTH